MRRLCLALLVPALAAAQPPADSAAYARARRLVNEGDGATGRAIVDSILAAATPGTPPYAEALFWRATLAERVGDAERDYRRIAVEYATLPRGADALVRLAQLDLVRGRVPAAREHLERLLRDHPDSAAQARGRYWLARAHLGAGDQRAACAALDAASAAAPAGTEVARQIAALRPRVANCETFLAGRTAAAAAPSTAARPTSPPELVRAAPDTTRSAPRPTVPAPTASAEMAPTTAAAPPRGGRQFTVQVAAYDTRPGADALAASLARRGWPARVAAPNGDRPPFRVRVGRFATRAEANALLRELRGQKIPAILTDAEPEQ
jgi:cell division septation protein DedD